MRRSILSGEFYCGMEVPATRLLARKLGVSRMTVINAYEQLLAEGYIEGKTGAGTYIASTLPETMLRVEQVVWLAAESRLHQKTMFSRRGNERTQRRETERHTQKK